ncbi:MAG: DEAD/DEAH box helicase [Deltaproteobacteria bacterium]|nr:MAG: DEAD/DEAH box helicase [Deltaproteobacteria bacterium]
MSGDGPGLDEALAIFGAADGTAPAVSDGEHRPEDPDRVPGSRAARKHQRADAALRSAMLRTWYPFFGRFAKLTPTQRASMPGLLRGESLLLVAPTASGKTEALLAPLIERHLPPGCAQDGLRIVVVAPTRALCNDLHRRLQLPVERCGLSITRRTGDARELKADAPSDLAVTTPESMDSLLCRHPRLFGRVDAVVVDEVHLLAGGPRGDQVRVMLERIERIRRGLRGDAVGALQRCASSASVASPESLARQFCGPAAELALPDIPGRPIVLRTLHAPDDATAAAALLEATRRDPRRKRLVFVNRRRDAEDIAERLRGRVPVMVHHGSIAREERLRVEERFRRERGAICLATSTLETGLDIGDVDEAWLVGPPADVASFLQRAGRASRRAAEVHAVGLVADAFEEARMRHLAGCAREGRLHGELLPMRPAVVAQQALSLCVQNPHGTVTVAALRERLPEDERPRWSVEDCTALLDSLARSGWLIARQHGWRLGERGETEFERGELHTAFSAPRTVEVREAGTGRVVGELAREAVDALSRGERFSLGGRKRAVRRVAEDALVVETTGGEGRTAFLAREAPRITAGLAGDLHAWIGHPPDAVPVRRVDGGRLLLSHFGGTVRGLLLADALQARRLGPQGVGPFFMTVKEKALSRFPRDEDAAAIRQRLRRLDEPLLRALESKLEAGRLARDCPLPLRRRWLRESIDLDGAVAWITSRRLVEELSG